MTDQPAVPYRICTRCAKRYAELWRTACPRCGGVVVGSNAGYNNKAKSRAWKDGWTPNAEQRSPALSKKRQGIASDKSHHTEDA